MNKNYFGVVVAVFLIVLMASSAFALTGRIGNARAVVTAEVGDTLQRTVKIINSNDVDVLIEIFPSGDLVDDITIFDNNFTLAPGEEKDARFEVYISKSGKTENNINIKFSEVDGKSGVGMSSVLIINAKEKGYFDELEEENNNENLQEEDFEIVPITGGALGVEGKSIGTGFLVIIALVLFLALLVTAFFYVRNRGEYIEQEHGQSKGEENKQKKNVLKK